MRKIENYKLTYFIAIIIISVSFIVLLIFGRTDSFILWVIPPSLSFNLFFQHLQYDFYKKRNKDALIIPLFDLKNINRHDMIIMVIALLFTMFTTFFIGYKTGCIFGFSIIIVNSFIGLMNPYYRTQLIIINKNGICIPEFGLQRWNNISHYIINKESGLLTLYLKDNSIKSTCLNKYIDLVLLENELNHEFNYN